MKLRESRSLFRGVLALCTAVGVPFAAPVEETAAAGSVPGTESTSPDGQIVGILELLKKEGRLKDDDSKVSTVCAGG